MKNGVRGTAGAHTGTTHYWVYVISPAIPSHRWVPLLKRPNNLLGFNPHPDPYFKLITLVRVLRLKVLR